MSSRILESVKKLLNHSFSRLLAYLCVLSISLGVIEGHAFDLTSVALAKGAVKSQSSDSAKTIKPPLKVQKPLIVIDPGHGGQDSGAQSISKPRWQEKTLNLTTAKFLKEYLQKLGYRTLMTREEDCFISLAGRAQMANAQKANLFVSIHYNSAPSAEAEGVEVFFYQSKQNKGRAAESKKLAQIVLRHILKQTQAQSRKVKHGNFAVIRETEMPAILVEGGFMTHEKELQRLKDSAYLKKIALGISKGIEEYLKEEK